MAGRVEEDMVTVVYRERPLRGSCGLSRIILSKYIQGLGISDSLDWFSLNPLITEPRKKISEDDVQFRVFGEHIQGCKLT